MLVASNLPSTFFTVTSSSSSSFQDQVWADRSPQLLDSPPLFPVIPPTEICSPIMEIQSPPQLEQPAPENLPILANLLEELQELKQITGLLQDSHGQLRRELSSITRMDLPTNHNVILDVDNELNDLIELSHESLASLDPSALTVSKDTRGRFNQSVFIPFAVEDSTQVRNLFFLRVVRS